MEHVKEVVEQKRPRGANSAPTEVSDSARRPPHGSSKTALDEPALAPIPEHSSVDLRAAVVIAVVIITASLSFAFRDPFRTKERSVSSQSPAVQPVGAESPPYSVP